MITMELTEEIVVPPSTVVNRDSCVHHWLLETPHGKYSMGECKKCHAIKQFSNVAVDDKGNDVGGFSDWAIDMGSLKSGDAKEQEREARKGANKNERNKNKRPTPPAETILVFE